MYIIHIFLVSIYTFIIDPIGFLEIYEVTSTDKSNFYPHYSIPYVIRFQKMYILRVVQFLAAKLLPKALCGNSENKTLIWLQWVLVHANILAPLPLFGSNGLIVII